MHFVPDSQNKYDTGIALQSGDLVGYCPPYLAKNVWRKKMNWSHLTVVKINRDAPSAFRLLCRWVFHLPENFPLFLEEEFQELSKTDSGKIEAFN